jgi:hypothetical protein
MAPNLVANGIEGETVVFFLSYGTNVLVWEHCFLVSIGNVSICSSGGTAGKVFEVSHDKNPTVGQTIDRLVQKRRHFTL